MHSVNRRTCLGLFAAGLPLGAFAQASPYPTKALRLVVPYPPGGANDVLARSVKTHWEKTWGQPVVVDNKPGGNGTLGTEIVARAPGDGYTLLMGSVATHVTSPALKGKAGRYDPLKDFVPVAMVGSTPLILTVHPSVKANDLKEFIALAKAKKDSVSYVSVGNGSAGHLSAALFEQMAGVEMLHVPYKGIAQGSNDLLAGLVNAGFSNVLNVLPHIKAGKLRALGVTGGQSLSILPDVPPIAQVLPGYSSELWWALFAPAGVPDAIAKKIRDETNAYLALPEARKKWAEEGITLHPMSGADFAAQITQDTKRWSELIIQRQITEES